MRLSHVIVLSAIAYFSVRFLATAFGEHGPAIAAVLLVVAFLSFMKHVVNA